MKNLLNWMLMVTIVVGLGMSVTSCKDDDDDKTSEQRNEDANPLDTDEAEVAWRWLSALTNAQSLPDDWAKKTFEPAVGVVSENNANTRIVVVADLDEAKTKFAGLADVATNQLGSEYTVSQSGVGKMTWTPSKAGAQNLAEVIVDTKLIPRLQKIIYCTSEQVGVNGLFSSNVKGTAYYRLGDVVEDKDGYYWVCVRPSFEQNDKGDSHWINIYNASESGKNQDEGKIHYILPTNINKEWDYLEKYNRRTIQLPTQLKYSREHMNNFTNLIWALLYPDAYATKVGTDPALTKNGLCGFDYLYHGKKFLGKVADFWDLPTNNHYNIWQILFNRTRQEMMGAETLCLNYQGYRWRVGRTGYVWVFNSKKNDGFQKNIPGSESGDMVLCQFADNGYDIRRYTGDETAANSNAVMDPQFNGKTYHYVVRYAKGSDLIENGKYLPYSELTGCKDVYRYNQKTNKDTQSFLETDSIIRNDKPRNGVTSGDLIGQNGLFYASTTDAEADGTKPVAIVCYVNNDLPVETGTNYYGLAIACKDLKESQWVDKNISQTCTSKLIPEKSELAGVYNKDGIANTNKLKKCTGHSHPFITVLSEAPKFTSDANKTKNGLSDWFIPSMGQWSTAMNGLGLYGTPTGTKYVFKKPLTDVKYGEVLTNFFKDKGDLLKGVADEEQYSYWLSSENSQMSAWQVTMSSDGSYQIDDKIYHVEGEMWFATYAMTYPQLVRPFIAFR